MAQALCDETIFVDWLLLIREGAGEQVEIRRSGCYTVLDPKSRVGVSQVVIAQVNPYFVKDYEACPKISPSTQRPALGASN